MRHIIGLSLENGEVRVTFYNKYKKQRIKDVLQNIKNWLTDYNNTSFEIALSKIDEGGQTYLDYAHVIPKEDL